MGLAYLEGMRAFGVFLAVIAVTMLVAAALTYPLYVALHPIMPEWRFDRVGSRLWEFGLMPLALVWVVRRLRLYTKRDWGYGAPRPRWLRQFGFGLVEFAYPLLAIDLHRQRHRGSQQQALRRRFRNELVLRLES